VKLPPGFMYHRPVPRAWQEQLDVLTPAREMAPWLQLAWLSGDPWETSTLPDGTTHAGVQRWAIYEMVPLRIWIGLIQAQRARGMKDDQILEACILAALQGPNPRDLGHYDEVLGKFITDAEVTRQEWELFREHKAVPKLFWILQGSGGGHRRHFTPLERKYLELAGLPAEPPSPGDLPYAEFDNRVLEMVRRRDRLQRQSGFLGQNEDEYSEAMVAFRRELVSWVTDQMRATLESERLDLSDLPTSSAKEDDPSGAIERRLERFIQTGSIYPKTGA
jgi:hypothetical protein